MRRSGAWAARAWVAAALVAAVTTPTSAFEPLFVVNTPPGVTTGLPLGANPPPGLYFINIAYGARSSIVGSGTSAGLSGFNASSINEAPIVLWSTPWTILGASWALLAITPMAAVKIFDGGDTIARIRGFNNPGFSPAMLSWNPSTGWFVKLGVIVWAPLGTISAGPLNNGLGNLGAPYWIIEEHLAVSYLTKEWSVTANLIYAINTRNTYSHVTDGNVLNVDLAAAKKFGAFEIGPVGYFSTQVTSDIGCEAFYGAGVCARGAKAGVGGLIGYDFGSVFAKLAVTDSVYIKNSFDGWRVWSTVTIKLTPDNSPPVRPIRAKF
jgi:hypothetical protein